MTTTTSRLALAAHMLADTVERGVAAGLPELYAIHATTYSEPSIGVREFEDVEAWADYCGATVVRETRVQGEDEIEFCEATVEEPGGFTWQIRTNRPAGTTSRLVRAD